MLIEQVEIAKKLGVSVNTVRRIALATNLPYELITGKRCYEWDMFIDAIQRGKNE